MPTEKTRTAPANGVPEVAVKVREQLVSAVQQGQRLSVDSAQAWVKVVSALPVPDLPKVPGVPTLPGVEAATTYVFDVAADLLGAQRDYALRLASVLVPERSA